MSDAEYIPKWGAMPVGSAAVIRPQTSSRSTWVPRTSDIREIKGPVDRGSRGMSFTDPAEAAPTEGLIRDLCFKKPCGYLDDLSTFECPFYD